MKIHVFIPIALLAASTGCHKAATVQPNQAPAAFGAAIVEVSGSKQSGRTGGPFEQPVVVQVNDAQGAAVQGASVTLSGPNGITFDPAQGLSDSSGQLSFIVTAPGISGRFQIVASTTTKDGKRVELKMDEIALGYEQLLGSQLNVRYCARCHDPESTAERVSNMDNLDPKPHAFTDGETLNKLSDADLNLIITRGGAALNKSASMPPYGYTLSKSDIQALTSYIRAVADPPYKISGMVYATK